MASSYQELETNIRGLMAALKAGALISALRSGAIGSGSLDGGGKLNPRQGLGGSGIMELTEAKKAKSKKCGCKSADGVCACNDTLKGDDESPAQEACEDACEEQCEKALFIPITKLDNELREVTGVVLQPEVTDAQGDIMGEAVIAKAAGDFLAGFNKTSTLGLMHSDFTKKFELRQSFIAPGDMVIANKTVRKGSWVMVVRVKEAKIWKAVKDGKITGFSIGGKAKAQKLVA